MNEHSRIYLHEDVFAAAGRVRHYLGNMGREWSWNPEWRWDLVGIFGQLRPAGDWPRAINLWEMDWNRLWRVLDQQFGAETPARFESWWRESNNDRLGGWDRFMYPGPGSPSLSELSSGATRPCVVHQVVHLRQGAKDDYFAWLVEDAHPRAAEVGWLPMMWLTALHGPTVTVLHAAPDWSALTDLGDALPDPDPAWRARVHTSLLHAWPESRYLQRD